MSNLKVKRFFNSLTDNGLTITSKTQKVVTITFIEEGCELHWKEGLNEFKKTVKHIMKAYDVSRQILS